MKKIVSICLAALLCAALLTTMVGAAATFTSTTVNDWSFDTTQTATPKPVIQANPSGDGIQIVAAAKTKYDIWYGTLLKGDFMAQVDVTFPEDVSAGIVPPYCYVSLRNTDNHTWLNPKIINEDGTITVDVTYLPEGGDWQRPDPTNAYTLPETGLGQTITVTLAHQGGSDSSWLILSQGDTELYRQELVDNDHDYINNANFYQGGVQWQLRNGEGTSDITFTNPRVATTFELPTQATLATQAPTTAATTASTAPTAVTTTTNHTTTDNNGGMQWWVWLIVGGGVVIVAAVVVVIVVMSKKKKK